MLKPAMISSQLPTHPLLVGLALFMSACLIPDADRVEGPSIDDFDITAAADTVSIYEVQLSGSATLAYLSNTGAELSLFVNGNQATALSFDSVSDRSHDIDLSLPLDRSGPNEIVAELSYEGSTLNKTLSVAVTPPAPTIEFGAWDQDYQPTVGLTLSADVTVTPPKLYSVEQVLYSINGGLSWQQAASSGADNWAVEIDQPDIGDQELSVLVTTANRGHQIDTQADTSIAVPAIFDCTTPGASMLPSPDMLQDNRTEVRSLLGYFGQPEGGHSVMAVISFTDDDGDPFETAARLLDYSPIALQVEFDVDRARCGGNCTLNYGLQLWVDGVLQCAENAFGQIREY